MCFCWPSIGSATTLCSNTCIFFLKKNLVITPVYRKKNENSSIVFFLVSKHFHPWQLKCKYFLRLIIISQLIPFCSRVGSARLLSQKMGEYRKINRARSNLKWKNPFAIYEQQQEKYSQNHLKFWRGQFSIKNFCGCNNNLIIN